MTETEWLNGWGYGRMYDVIRSQATTRQVRLYMVACCRLKAAHFFDSRILRALETAEWCADDSQAEAVANAVWDELVTWPRPRLPQTGREGELAQALTGAWQLLDEWWDGEHYSNSRHAIAHAAYLCLRDHPLEVLTGGEGNAAEYCARAIDSAESLLLGVKSEEVEQDSQETEVEIRKAIANLLRDIFGNPFQSVSFNPAWRTPTVQSLATAAYEERSLPAGTLDADRLAVLADALEEAGCDNDDILAHLRGPGPHVRGCWVVDLLLEKE
jgi:hypothetical protein